MKDYTESRLETSLGSLLNHQIVLKKEYKKARLNKPFDKYYLDQMLNEIKRKSQEIANLRQELETYQLEFLFGA